MFAKVNQNTAKILNLFQDVIPVKGNNLFKLFIFIIITLISFVFVFINFIMLVQQENFLIIIVLSYF